MVLKTFNVLDRQVDIHRNYLLEASAGTGKTFSIENIVVRLLLEGEAFSLEKILVVTFTRAAVRDLKTRIRTNIEKALDFVVRKRPEIPDYLLKICEEGEASIAIARRRLEQALLIFDQAQIFTIHSFCTRALSEGVFESNMGIDSVVSDEPLSQTIFIKIIRDFFRTEIRPEIYSPAQLKLVLKEFGYYSSEELENVLLELITKNIEIEESSSYLQLFEEFKHLMQTLKQNLNPHQFKQDFMAIAPLFKGVCNRERKIKSNFVKNMEHFASLFEKEILEKEDLEWLISDQLSLIRSFCLENLKKGKHHSDAIQFAKLCQWLDRNLAPFVSGAKVLSRMASDCQKFFRMRLTHEEKLGFDDILIAMKTALKNYEFATRVRGKYKAALIDEFQDTDPLQWEIFKKLFLDFDRTWGYLYLVGDPKQSIYSFRQADIYTYLDAATTLGSQHHASLDTNYRSHSRLVEALNVLFSEAASRGLLELPRLKREMNYLNVRSSPSIANRKLTEDRGAIHFLLAENQKNFSLEKLEQEKFFPYIAHEIQRLHKQCEMPLGQCAVLVADRYQAERFSSFFKEWKIPVLKQRGKNLTTSKALPALRELLKGIVDNYRRASLKVALGGKIIQWTHRQILDLEAIDKLEMVVSQIYKLKNVLETQGFARFYDALMDSSWHSDNYSVKERLLSQDGGIDFLNELQEIVNLLLKNEYRYSFSLNGLIDYLDNFHLLHSENEQMIASSIEESDAVNILTLHASKGLEFSVVFTLGLIKRTQNYSSMMTVFKEGKLRLVPIVDKEGEDYKQYCREINAEKLRLLYVAMTRAKDRLYCPLVVGTPDTEEPGIASPMELFLSKLGLRIEIDVLKAYFDQLTCEVDYTTLEGNEKESFFWRKEFLTDLEKPKNVFIPGEDKYIRSFTSLCAELDKTPLLPSLNETFSSPSDFFSIIKTPHTLPSNADTGNFLHHLLETISFADAKNVFSPKNFVSFVSSKTLNTQFIGWEQVLCEMLFNAIKTPIFEDVCLADINPDRIFREAEFLYTSTLSKGYLKGFIDLFFEHQGKYYLLDWKSNWLGESFFSYHSQNMQKAMNENHYLLQADIYKETLKKYLNIVDKRPFLEIFGGTFYVFLRGLSVNEGCRYGVYKVP